MEDENNAQYIEPKRANQTAVAPLPVKPILAVALNVGSLLGGIWLALAPTFGFLPRPYVWLAAAGIGLPWIAVGFVWLYPEYFTLFISSSKRYPLFLVFSPTMLAILISYDYMSFVHRGPAILQACTIGAALFVAAALPDAALRKLRSNGTAGLVALSMALLLSFVYGYSTVIQINCVLDHSLATVYKTAVLEKKNPAKGAPYLRTEPWGPVHAVRTVKISYKLFHLVQPGGEVCMVQRDGALGIPWYVAQACPWNGGPVLLQEGGSL